MWEVSVDGYTQEQLRHLLLPEMSLRSVALVALQVHQVLVVTQEQVVEARILADLAERVQRAALVVSLMLVDL
jgi:hypothetical protein